MSYSFNSCGELNFGAAAFLAVVSQNTSGILTFLIALVIWLNLILAIPIFVNAMKGEN